MRGNCQWVVAYFIRQIMLKRTYSASFCNSWGFKSYWSLSEHHEPQCNVKLLKWPPKYNVCFKRWVSGTPRARAFSTMHGKRRGQYYIWMNYPKLSGNYRPGGKMGRDTTRAKELWKRGIKSTKKWLMNIGRETLWNTPTFWNNADPCRQRSSGVVSRYSGESCSYFLSCWISRTTLRVSSRKINTLTHSDTQPHTGIMTYTGKRTHTQNHTVELHLGCPPASALILLRLALPTYMYSVRFEHYTFKHII